MTANERRAEIIRILTGRRFETIPNLASQLDVHRSTVVRDVETLSLDHLMVDEHSEKLLKEILLAHGSVRNKELLEGGHANGK